MILYHFVFKNKNARTFTRAFFIQLSVRKIYAPLDEKSNTRLFWASFLRGLLGIILMENVLQQGNHFLLGRVGRNGRRHI